MADRTVTSRMGKAKVDAFVAKYKLDPKHKTVASKIAHLLLDARKALPGVPIPVTQVARVVHHLARTPKEDSKQAQIVRGSMQRARELLMEQHECSLVNERGLGVRATTDADDHVAKRVRDVARRVSSATRMLSREAALIDVNEVKNQENRRWFRTDVLPTVKLLQSEKRLDRLAGLLPAKGE
jgi:hypothetical protein